MGLIDDHAYTPSAAATAVAARTAYEAAQPATASLPKSAPLLAVVGDMVTDPDSALRDQEEGSPIASRFKDVSDMVVQSNCTYFCCLGDNVYENGQLSNYAWGYERTFGRVNAKCLPVPGNHEYQTPNGADYYTYFGNLAGPVGAGYYAVNIANWRFYTLNSCTTAMWSAGSPLRQWFTADIAAHPNVPKIIAWHHPRWTDGSTSAVGDDDNYDAIWQEMYAHGKFQIALVGHDHNYQRWDTIKSAGPGANPVTVADGITQFVVGCGGNNFFNLNPPRPGYGSTNLSGGPGNANRSTYGIDRAFGVLFLRLGPASWDWLFKSVDGVVYDQGTRANH